MKRGKVTTDEHGIKYDSETERHFYGALQKVGQEFQFQVKKELIGPAIHKPSNKKELSRLPLLRDRGIEAVCLTIDFVFEREGITYYCDTKGSKKHVMRDSKMRYDIFKRQLYEQGMADKTRIVFVSAAEVKVLCQYAAYVKGEFWQAFSQIKER